MQNRKITITIVLFWLATTFATVLFINTRYVNLGIAPKDFINVLEGNKYARVYKKYYNGIITSDRIFYNNTRGEYEEYKDEIDLEKVSNLDFTLFEKHYEELKSSEELEEYFNVKKIITNVDGEPTMVLLCEKYTEYDVEFTVINLKDKAIVTDKVNIRDLFI